LDDISKGSNSSALQITIVLLTSPASPPTLGLECADGFPQTFSQRLPGALVSVLFGKMDPSVFHNLGSELQEFLQHFWGSGSEHEDKKECGAAVGPSGGLVSYLGPLQSIRPEKDLPGVLYTSRPMWGPGFSKSELGPQKNISDLE
jgi:hypothetical protein